MKKFNFCLSVLLFSALSINSIFALYPEKTIEPKAKGLLSVYIGGSLGTAVTTTFGNNSTEYGFDAFYIPTRFLDGGTYSANLGITFFNQVRVEGEYSYFYQEYKYLTTEDTSPSLDLKPYQNNTAFGYQRMNKAFSINFYYDLTLLSNRIYPYIGFGTGRAEFETYYVDTKLLEDNVGERYFNDPVKGNFSQFIGGIEYKLDVIHASYYIQYKYVAGPKITITQNNPGTVTTPPVGATDTTIYFEKPIEKEFQYKNHSISFGFRFFL